VKSMAASFSKLSHPSYLCFVRVILAQRDHPLAGHAALHFYSLGFRALDFG